MSSALEVAHTPDGSQILSNFVKGIYGCSNDWSVESFIEDAIKQIREQVDDGKAVRGCSVGVHSSVAVPLI